MDLAHAHRTIENALAPATAVLGYRQAKTAFRMGLFGGVHVLPRFAAILTLGWFGATFVAGAPIFAPLALPLVLAVVPFGIALSLRTATRRQSRIDARTAALIVDRNNHNKDRLSAALELSEDPLAVGTDRRAALARAAIADGVETVDRVDLSRTEVPEPAMRMPWAHAGFALVIALVPAALRIGPDPEDPPNPGGIPIATANDSTDREGDPPPDADDPGSDTDDDTERPPRRGDQPPAKKPDQRRSEPEPPRPEPPPEAQRPRGAGTGSAGTEAAGERGQRAPTAGETKTANAGAASASGQGGGGQGAAKSETPSEQSEPRPPRKQKSKPRRPKKPSETEGGEQEKSAGNPSGPSRGGGKMAAVGNQRSGMDRGRDRDDDPETDDEEVEDEKEETEQRGGVMPMTRDRMQAPSRELSISGNGPPGDGRGGPTPPKKSRGTASLVLGIRLPDQVRGQPNPGTAKTTIEQIPPVPQDEAARPTAPATSPGPSPHVQSPAAALGDLADAVRRYHELLRAQAAPAAEPNTATPNTLAPEPTRDE